MYVVDNSGVLRMMSINVTCELFNMLYFRSIELEHLAIDKVVKNNYNNCAKIMLTNCENCGIIHHRFCSGVW